MSINNSICNNISDFSIYLLKKWYFINNVLLEIRVTWGNLTTILTSYIKPISMIKSICQIEEMRGFFRKSASLCTSLSNYTAVNCVKCNFFNEIRLERLYGQSPDTLVILYCHRNFYKCKVVIFYFIMPQTRSLYHFYIHC